MWTTNCIKCHMNRVRYVQNTKRNINDEIPWRLSPRQTKKVFLPNPAKPKFEIIKPPKAPSFEKVVRSRVNQMGIQMLSKGLFEQVFKGYLPVAPTSTTLKEKLAQCRQVLEKHGMVSDEQQFLKEINFELPELKGKNIEEHFYIIGEEQAGPYRKEIMRLIRAGLPEKPERWIMQEGWTEYAPGKPPKKIDFPKDKCLVFDVEVCVSAGQSPVMATAVGKEAWYGWVSKSLIEENLQPLANGQYTLDMLIPLESVKNSQDIEKPNTKRVVIGHNVSYDRARIKEQYYLNKSELRFVDTMSLHICISGLTSYQKATLKSKKTQEEDESHSTEEWRNLSSLNSLLEVHKLYCGEEISKTTRDLFVEGSLTEIKKDFDECIKYCANDVEATFNVLKKIFPMFLKRFPHPVTFAGMLELGTGLLPVNANWLRYINNSEQVYEDLEIESKLMLSKRADQACQLLHDEKYKENMWMWDEDWEVKEIKLKRETKPKKAKSTDENKDKEKLNKEVSLVKEEPKRGRPRIQSKDEDFIEDPLAKKFEDLFTKVSRLPVKIPLLPGYPNWYRKLCTKPDTEDLNWVPSPHLISTSMQITPKLLSLMWEGYPLHYLKGYGWGFLVPFNADLDVDRKIPLKILLEKYPVQINKKQNSNVDANDYFKQIEMNIGMTKKGHFLQHLRMKKKAAESEEQAQLKEIYDGSGVFCDVILEDCCYFLKLPHKNGPSFRVGNPLARDFLNKFSENVLSGDTEAAERVLSIARQLSYWRNNRDRIRSQMVVRLDNENENKNKKSEPVIASIIPQVVVSGTLTRRAVEPTWMTASNAQTERIGSELRAMVQAPDKHYFVGADVDSQELWIASVIGDAFHAQTHGCTPLGWMTLSGTKTAGTDMHSVTAKAVGISRDHAKIINYARIYGAGIKFAERLLKQFNPSFSDSEAKSKASKMFALTKGKQVYKVRDEYLSIMSQQLLTKYDAYEMAKIHNVTLNTMFESPQWVNGTESAMFNSLEKIANNPQPSTPFLNAKLSRALDPSLEKSEQFLPTRVNWVVQSGAVDFLHLMLVCVRWIMGNKMRFCLSFHDEVRYLVKEEDRYKAALAMHITNLLTRSFCCVRLGLKDIPQSVAFFSSVEIDKVLRKDASNDCITPSNPHGLQKGFKIPLGESLDIYETLEKLPKETDKKFDC